MVLGLKWIKMMKPRERDRNCCLCASAPDSLGGVRCLKCLLHTGAVVIGAIFPSELEGGCLGSLRYSAWPLLGFGFVCWCIRGDLRAGKWDSKAYPCPPSVIVIPSSQWQRNMAQVWKRDFFVTGPSGLCCSFPAGKPFASEALRHL